MGQKYSRSADVERRIRIRTTSYALYHCSSDSKFGWSPLVRRRMPR